MNDTTIKALMNLYGKCVYDQGQHDLPLCRLCHQEASWHTGILTHKEGCAVLAVKEALKEEAS